MNIFICSTRLYYSYFFSKWEKDVDLTTALSGVINHDLQELFMDERDCGPGRDVTLFWRDCKYTDKDLKILKREINNGNILYAIPCIPVNNIDDGLELELSERQNYIGKIVDIIIKKYQEIPCEVYIIAHDRDIFEEEAERLFNEKDIIDSTFLAKIIEMYSINLKHIYGFQHTSGVKGYNKMYALLCELIDENFNNDIIDSIIGVF